MAQGVCELLWLKKLMQDIHLLQKESFLLYCDNKVAISIANNPVQHDRTKHIEIDQFFIKEKLDDQSLRINYTNSGNQLADVFTKSLCRRLFHSFICKMGMRDIHTPS